MNRNKITSALEYARDILDSVGLSDWSVWSNNSYSTIAVTQFGINKMVFSQRYITIATKEDFRKTVIHEATHAKLGYEAGHGEDFVRLCRELSPNKPYDKYCIHAPIHRYNVVCSICGDTGQTNKNIPVFCELCPKEGRGVQEYIKIKNELETKEWASK